MLFCPRRKIESKHLFHLHKGGTTRTLFFPKIFSFPKWRSCILLELVLDFAHNVCFAKLATSTIFGCTTKDAREIEKNFPIYTKICLLLQKRIGKILWNQRSNRILSGNDGKTLREYFPLVCLPCNAYMQERHQQKDCLLEW